jgi:hypothetical protein
MPLHEWSDRPGWRGMHHLWITELLRWVKPRLPVGYRAYIGLTSEQDVTLDLDQTYARAAEDAYQT